MVQQFPVPDPIQYRAEPPIAQQIADTRHSRVVVGPTQDTLVYQAEVMEEGNGVKSEHRYCGEDQDFDPGNIVAVSYNAARSEARVTRGGGADNCRVHDQPRVIASASVGCGSRVDVSAKYPG
jgi:hypothetical protein